MEIITIIRRNGEVEKLVKWKGKYVEKKIN
jgi:hypothetical protein